jgi:hypothetical protein
LRPASRVSALRRRTFALRQIFRLAADRHRPGRGGHPGASAARGGPTEIARGWHQRIMGGGAVNDWAAWAGRYLQCFPTIVSHLCSASPREALSIPRRCKSVHVRRTGSILRSSPRAGFRRDPR